MISSPGSAQVSQAPELGGAQTDIGSTITSMLEAAEEEFATTPATQRLCFDRIEGRTTGTMEP